MKCGLAKMFSEFNTATLCSRALADCLTHTHTHTDVYLPIYSYLFSFMSEANVQITQNTFITRHTSLIILVNRK